MLTEYNKNLRIAEELVSYYNDMPRKDGFSIEINLTQSCNFACSYCFENQKCNDNKILNIEKVIDTIDNTINDEFFVKTFYYANIVFWGGEPSLNMKHLKKVFDHFKSNSRVRFMIYTNGSNIDKLLPVLLESKHYRDDNFNEKFKVQISYDGMPIHDIKRKDKKGNPTSKIVLGGMEKLHQYDVPFSLKSTLTIDTFEYIPEVWEDIYELRKKYGERIGYAPTIDYYHEEKDSRIDVLENSLLEVAKKEYKNIIAGGKPIVSFFDENKNACGVGQYMICIDTDENVYPCHGGPYQEYQNELCGGTFDSSLTKQIKINRKMFGGYNTSKECRECVATFCPRCPLVKKSHSKEKNFLKSISDNKSQPQLCEYYKIMGNIMRGLKLLLGSK